MKKNLFQFLPLVATFLIFATAVCAASRSGDPKLDRAIEKANSEFEVAIKSGDSKTIAAPYMDEGVFIGFDGSCTKGRLEIEKLYKARLERIGFASAAKIISKKLVVDGDLAYESGYGEISYVKEGKTSTNGGRFLTVWQKQADGDWKILRNVVLP
jgi:uncharacterized protein (TIGR02246 family)